MAAIDLRLQGLTRHYGAVRALDDFSHVFTGGQVHALIGKNGSGKSTFIKMISGATPPSRGTIWLGDRPVSLRSPQEALQAGIVTVHQELSLVPGLSVAENIFLGRLPKRGGLIDWSALHSRASALLQEMGAAEIDPHQPVETLSVGRQQVVEIVKASSLDPRILLLDEPTSALASHEVEQLFGLVRKLKARGVTIIYISHRLAELPQIADTVTALRDGIHAGSLPIAEATPPRILDMMFGDLPPLDRPDHSPGLEPLLEVRNLRLAPWIEDVSFTLHKGEVLGIAGMLGSGRTEILHTIFGARAQDAGHILLDGREIGTLSLPARKEAGLAYASEDRKQAGLVLDHAIHTNLVTAPLRRIAQRGLTWMGLERPHVDRQIADLQIKVSDARLPVSSLSGGNQQKVVVGNWLNTAPRVLLLDEPGRGVDVQAKRQIYQIIWDQAARGLSSIVVSTELEDLAECCDRVLVLRDGRITAEFAGTGLDPKSLYAATMAQPEGTRA
ncbi:sugar ABC transporter ATP-binding protein [Gemmobacter serpentinus]|uniref:sugar ABC transporter ATP-binding protein n=1 Tax=Gemmobacter serpentinus TaxID=2652247 RepID=UPI001CF606C0|nr:sugar ABC transporter ATP-binding protein [Gemmobacter serpentinus]